VADQEGNTALHVASLSNKTECMRVLLRAGATDSLSVGNKDGKTPINISKELDHAESIEVLKQSASDKLVLCENVKIDWGLNEADGIYDNPLDLLDIKPEFSDEETLNDSKAETKARSSPPTPPRHRRQLPTRPVSQMILPGAGYMKGIQGLSGMSPLVSGLTLVGSDSPSVDKLSGGSPVVRRRAPVPRSTETVAVNVRSSMFVPSTVADTMFSSMTSTFGHGPKNKATNETGGDPSDSPPPIPPVRCSSVSRDRDKRFGVDVPLPPLPAKPKFDDPGPPAVKPPPPEVKTRPPPEVANRRAPPVPPVPNYKRSGSEMKPPAPPLPMHRRSKSEGRSPFGEDIPAGPGSVSKPPVEKKLSDPVDVEEGDKGETCPLPPPRPLKLGSVRVTSSPSLVANGDIGARSFSLPRPPPRTGSELTSGKPPPQTIVKKESNNKAQEPVTEEEEEANPVPESPVPSLPPRSHGTGSPSGLPRRVQALYDCEADNADELTFKEGDVILVQGEAEDAEWWEGEVEGKPGKTGVFPISFVRVLPE